MNWSAHLEDNENITWQGRPAPRCFTFRNWMHSLFGIVLTIGSGFWLWYGIQLNGAQGKIVLILLPLPFLIAGLYLAIGHLLLARLEWDHVFYALTDRRLIVQKGIGGKRVESLPLADLLGFQLRPIGEQLGTVAVRVREREKALLICCIEYPKQLTDLLEPVLVDNGIELQPSTE